MNDKDYAPLNNACIRALNDKLYEKRKVGALEVERWGLLSSLAYAGLFFIYTCNLVSRFISQTQPSRFLESVVSLHIQ